MSRKKDTGQSHCGVAPPTIEIIPPQPKHSGHLLESDTSLSTVEHLRTLIGDRLGLRVSDLEGLAQQFHTACHQLGMAKAQYLELLRNTLIHDPCWQDLIATLTNTESYFFRDAGQFELLQQKLLPELIERRSPQRKLTILSFGCATGEEPYSVAMVLDQLLPNLAEWDIQIIGLDINADVLKIAAQGMYHDWSFRGMNPGDRHHYFDQTAPYPTVIPHLKRLTTFAQFNFREEDFFGVYPSVDLFLCRNVWIYLTEAAIAQLLEQVYQVLQPDGYLLTGHAELQRSHLKKFHTRIFAQSCVYQPRIPSQPQPQALPHLSPALLSTQRMGLQLSHPMFTQGYPHPPRQQCQQRIQTYIQNKHYAQAITLLEQQLHSNPGDATIHYTLASLHTELRQFSPAIYHCRQALRSGQQNFAPYYLLAEIAQAQHRLGDAKQYLWRILYFDPEAALAYCRLARIYAEEKRGDRAQSLAHHARHLLAKLPGDRILEPRKRVTVQQLLTDLPTSAQVYR